MDANLTPGRGQTSVLRDCLCLLSLKKLL